MPYVVLRGNLGMANTKVYGLPLQEIERVSPRLRIGPKNESKDELTLYNSVVYVMNQLEYFLGYRVVSSTCQWDNGQPMWTLGRPIRHQKQRYRIYFTVICVYNIFWFLYQIQLRRK